MRHMDKKTLTVLWETLEERFDGFKKYRYEITGRSMAWKIGGY